MLRRFADSWTAFFVPNPLVEKLPDQTREPVGDRANSMCVSQARDETAIEDREDCARGLRRGVGGLIEDASHLAVRLIFDSLNWKTESKTQIS